MGWRQQDSHYLTFFFEIPKNAEDALDFFRVIQIVTKPQTDLFHGRIEHKSLDTIQKRKKKEKKKVTPLWSQKKPRSRSDARCSPYTL